MFASSIKLLLLISLYVSLAHGRHCETDNKCYGAKFTLSKDSDGDTMIAKRSSNSSGTVFHYDKDDDEELTNEKLLHFSPCDYCGHTTFDIGNTFELCVCHKVSNDCYKRRLVKNRHGLPIIDSNITMVIFDEVEPLHARLEAEVQGSCSNEETAERTVKIREKGNHVDSNSKKYKLRLTEPVRCNDRDSPARDEL